MIRSPGQTFGDTCDLNGALPYSRKGSKSANAKRYIPAVANFASGVGVAVAFGRSCPSLRQLPWLLLKCQAAKSPVPWLPESL
jgi:hypothetical protein